MQVIMGKSNTGFRLVPKSVTLNDPEQHNSGFCHYTDRGLWMRRAISLQ